MNKVRVRVEAKRNFQNTSKQERDKNLAQLLKIFKRKCSEYGIMSSFKEHEFFIRKCDLRRWKKIKRNLVASQICNGKEGNCINQESEWQ